MLTTQFQNVPDHSTFIILMLSVSCATLTVLVKLLVPNILFSGACRADQIWIPLTCKKCRFHFLPYDLPQTPRGCSSKTQYLALIGQITVAREPNKKTIVYCKCFNCKILHLISPQCTLQEISRMLHRVRSFSRIEH